MNKTLCVYCLCILLSGYSCHTSRNLNNKTPQQVYTAFKYDQPKKAIGSKGVVASAHPLASMAGIKVMEQGGNAIDAAIAVQLALAVVYPGAGNLGGGGFMVAHLKNGQHLALDYREMAPGKAHRDMYLEADGTANTNKSQNGHLASGVPGTIAGVFESLKYARLNIDKLIAPAIELAAKGFVITDAEARSLNSLQSEFKKQNTVLPVFVKTTAWKAGDTLIQTDLSKTLQRIKENGAPGFYEGETARLIVEEMKRGNGIISLDDLKNYKAQWRTPHEFDYKGYRIVSMPMPSSGGVLIHQMLRMIEPYPIADYGFQSPQAVQLMVEAERRAYADRAAYMGDADFYKVPVKQITSDSYIKSRMADYIPATAGKSANIKEGSFKESEETTHISVMDAEGNAVAVTTTLNNGYGSRTVIGHAGFLMNNEMDDFSIKPGVPNFYGAIGGEANAIQPGKRMLSSMTPTIVLRDGKPYLVIGTPGGTTIPTSVFQTLVNLLEYNMSVTDAVNKPKFHHQWLPDRVDIEKGFMETTKAALEKMGYTIYQRNQIGRMEVIKKLTDGKMEAVADIRGDDAAFGF